MSNREIKIGVAGLGTVGSGVINLLKKNEKEIRKKSGFDIKIQCVSSKNKNKKRNCDISDLNFYSDPLEMIENEDIDILVELIGGETTAKDLVLKSLKKKYSCGYCK